MSEQQPGKGGKLGSLPGGKIAQLNTHKVQQMIVSNIESLTVEFSWKTRYSTHKNYIGGFSLKFCGTNDSRKKFKEMWSVGKLNSDVLEFEDHLMQFAIPGASMPLEGLSAVASSPSGLFRVVKGDLLVQSNRWSIVTESSEAQEIWYKAGQVESTSEGSLELLDELNRLKGTVGVHQFCIDGTVLSSSTSDDDDD